MPVQTQDNVFWLYAGLGKVFVYQGGAHTNITRVKTSPNFDLPALTNLVITTTAPTVAVA